MLHMSMDSCSVTHGQSPRTHIWTFASGYFNGTSGDTDAHVRCPCDEGNTFGSPPFVGNDYFCDSVATSIMYTRFVCIPIMRCGMVSRASTRVTITTILCGLRKLYQLQLLMTLSYECASIIPVYTLILDFNS